MNRIHGGNPPIRYQSGTDSFIDFSANINPLGPPSWFRQLVNRNLETLVDYPDPACTELCRAAAQYHGIPAEQVIAANGASEIIFALPRIHGIGGSVIPVPAYGDYRYASVAAKVPVTTISLRPEDHFELDLDELSAVLAGPADRPGLVWLGQPNNPTGGLLDCAGLKAVCNEHSRHLFVIDESFAEFLEGYTSIIAADLQNVVVLRSLTKIFGVPGLRVAYAVCRPEVRESIEDALPTWSVNTLAQKFGAKALADREYQERTRACVSQLRKRFIAQLTAIPGIEVHGGEANFILLRCSEMSAFRINEKMSEAGIAIRTCGDFDGLDESYFRIAVRSAAENDLFINTLREVVSRPPIAARRAKKRKAATLMLQGTASNAGKSVLTTALCRILLQDGIRVAPFKAQNMSLNSYVTADGGEMGRAQVVQAQACRLAPEVRMNPVLLKPSSQTGSQVILCGKPIAFMEARQYHTDKTMLFDEATRCFDELASEYDAVVLEGAGSPGEVNLKRYDMVNMKMARYAEAPVLLVGDIDRGGVFASFIGTLDVLDEWERRLIKGFLINKFRGDASLLGSATDYTFNYTGKRTIGTIPMIDNLGIPDEDSVSFKQEMGDRGVPKSDTRLVIGLVDLPHISNFTDFDPLRNEPDVEVRIVRKADELDGCDTVILPGSKNVFADLTYLKKEGIASRIASMAGECDIIGICGGYQMLGRRLLDPSGIESTDGETAGLGLLNLDTVLGDEKILKQAEGKHVATGIDLVGYEIHHGRTKFTDTEPWTVRNDGEIIGVSHAKLPIYGTYLHGLFDSDRFRRWYIDSIRAKRGLPPLERGGYVHDVEGAIERLASIVRRHIDVEAIYAMMRL